MRRFLKVWTQTVLAPTITTLLFMAIFVWALGGSGRAPAGVNLGTFLAPGLMVMAIIQNAFQNPSSSILIAKVQGNIVDILMPPLSAGELTFGFAIGGVVRGLMVGASLWLIFSFWPGIAVTVRHGWIIVYFAFSASLMMSLIGTLTGVWAQKFDHSAAITNFLVVPLSLLSGTFYTIDRLPPILQTVSNFNPFFYLIDGVRYGFIGRSDSNIMIGIFVVLALNIILWFTAHRVFKVGYRLKA